MPYKYKSYTSIIKDRLLVIKEEKAKIERTVGAAFLAGQPVEEAKKAYEALTAEAVLLDSIQSAVIREYGGGLSYSAVNANFDSQW